VNVDNPIDTKRLVRISFYPSKIDLGHPFSRWYSSHSQSWVVHDIAKNQHYRWFINYEALSTSITHYQLYDYPLPAITFTSIFQSKIDLVHPNYPLLTLLLGECQKTQGHVFFHKCQQPSWVVKGDDASVALFLFGVCLINSRLRLISSGKS